jgi:hypothetical protein
MNQRPFVRKMIYLGLIAALLVPLSLLSMPARRGNSQEAGSKGGVLAQLRDKNRLSQSSLGEIDPTSETIKLVTLGLRGVATFALQNKAKQYELKEDWTKLKATLEQITKLEPNFPSVWENQAWNLSHNISAQFDDYHDRYFWHIEGARFLQDGIRHNDTAPRLEWYLGWIISYKLGRADEHLQFRRLFREDTDFNGKRKIEDRDNWLVGREFHLAAEEMAERIEGRGVNNPLMFYYRAPMCRLDYAQALEEEGVLDEKAGAAWDQALTDWIEFGKRELGNPDMSERIDDVPLVKQQIEDLNKRLAELPPGDVPNKLKAEKRKQLADAEIAALDKDVATRTPDEVQLANTAQQKLIVHSDEFEKAVDREYRDEARKISESTGQLATRLVRLESNRDNVNYDYWKTRCEMERKADTLEARRLTNQAQHAYQDLSDLQGAKVLYDQAFAKWDEVLKQFPSLRTNTIINEDMMIIIRKYRVLLDKLDIKELPKDFPLQDIINAHPTGQ